MGEISLKVKKIISRSDGKTSSPILKALDVRRRRYSSGVRMRLAKFASKMSYGDACLEFETAMGVHVPNRTIHGFVRDIALMLLSSSRMAAKKGLVLGDSTKVRARARRDMNNVRVLISGGGRMLTLEVNEE